MKAFITRKQWEDAIARYSQREHHALNSYTSSKYGWIWTMVGEDEDLIEVLILDTKKYTLWALKV